VRREAAASMIEISVKGKWVNVPAVECEGSTIIVTGKSLKIARVHDEAWVENELRDPGRCIQAIRESGKRCDILTFTQLPPGRPVEYDYYQEPDSIAAIRLTSFKEWWEGLPQETRKNVRRAEKRGVRVRTEVFDDELVKKLVEINNSSPMRQGRPYHHYGKSFEQTKRDHRSFAERSDFICAYCEDEIIGYLKLVYRGQVASVLNLCTKDSHQDKRPANALLKVAVERCAAKGVKCFTYGLFNYGNKLDSPITQFKSRHGFEEVLVPRYFVPLTYWGKVNLKLGLHRGFLGVLPNRIILAGLAVRAKLYSFYRWFISRCSLTSERPNCNRQMECSNPPAGSNS
jgi:GNAT acetyltransferase-like protein